MADRKPPNSINLDEIYKNVAKKYNLRPSQVKEVFQSQFKFAAQSIKDREFITIHFIDMFRIYFNPVALYRIEKAIAAREKKNREEEKDVNQ